MNTRSVLPEHWLPPKGYSNGIIATGTTLFIAGQVGWDPTVTPGRFPTTFAAQFDLALRNVLSVLAAAGGNPAQLCRLTIYVTDKREYQAALREVGQSWKALVGKHYPAMSLLEVKALLEDDAKVELEATATL